MFDLHESKRVVLKTGYDRHGDKISLSKVTEGFDGANQLVEPHFLYTKHRGNGIKDESFSTLEQASHRFNSKLCNGDEQIRLEA